MPKTKGSSAKKKEVAKKEPEEKEEGGEGGGGGKPGGGKGRAGVGRGRYSSGPWNTMLAVIFVYLSVKLCYDGRLVIVANETELGKSKEFRAADEPDVVKASADIAGMVAVIVLWIVDRML